MVMVSTTREGERSAWSCLSSSASPASIITLTTNTAVIVAPAAAAARVAQTQQPRRRLARSLPLAAVVRESVAAGRWRQQAGAQQGGCIYRGSLSRHTATKLQLLSRSDPPSPTKQRKSGRVESCQTLRTASGGSWPCAGGDDGATPGAPPYQLTSTSQLLATPRPAHCACSCPPGFLEK
ncbi:hypothetical protein E2C01_016178 [Portunus trituberculatus]|uniref:Uncharacterized protein n=1 Tax=Portunus trituberculatus TaxID=210409 RepID=A0A5B7DPX5_PORTR|nr:hypothetical protein [Portunus trituberculatus]